MEEGRLTVLRSTIVEEARSWIGVRFIHRGRSRRGVDCAGLLYVVFNNVRVGIKCDDFNAYQRQMTSGMVFRNIRKFATRISADEARDGDVVLMNFGGHSTHLGILTPKTIIHADSGLQQVVEYSFDRDKGSQGRAVAYFRMAGVT